MAENPEDDFERFKRLYLAGMEGRIVELERDVGYYERRTKAVRAELSELRKRRNKAGFLGDYWDVRIQLADSELHNLNEQREKLEGELEAARKVIDGSGEEKLKATFDRLRAIALSNDSELTITEDEIRLGIGQIDIEHDGVVYDIGRFELAIRPDTDDPEEMVGCFNLTRTVTPPESPEATYFHPHVYGDLPDDKGGQCCLGNIYGDVEEMVLAREWVALVYLMAVYLKSVNVYDEGWEETERLWPKKKKRKKRGAKNG